MSAKRGCGCLLPRVAAVSLVCMWAALSAVCDPPVYESPVTLFPGDYWPSGEPWWKVGYYTYGDYRVEWAAAMIGELPQQITPVGTRYTDPRWDYTSYGIGGIVAESAARNGFNEEFGVDETEVESANGVIFNINESGSRYLIRVDDYGNDFGVSQRVGQIGIHHKVFGTLFPGGDWHGCPITADIDCFEIPFGTFAYDEDAKIKIKSSNDKAMQVTVEYNGKTIIGQPGNSVEVTVQKPTTEIKITVSAVNSADLIRYSIITSKLRKPRSFRQSKSTRWIDYSDPRATAPREKGDDADAGAKPSFFPDAGIDNVSLLPGVVQRLFSVNVPCTPVGISPVLSYAPPAFTKSSSVFFDQFGNRHDSVSYAISASPSPYGHCWSDNLSPCIEQSASKSYTLENEEWWEYSMSFNNAPIPSASFYGGLYQLDNGPAEFSIVQNWEAEALTQATYNGSSVVLWQSGVIADQLTINEDEIIHDYTPGVPGVEHVARAAYIRPGRIQDRNENKVFFNYEASFHSLTSSVSICIPLQAGSESKRDLATAHVRRTTQVARETPGNVVLQTTSIGGGSPFVASVSAAPRPATTIAYTDVLVARRSAGNLYDFYVRLISAVTLPDNTVIRYAYTNVLDDVVIGDIHFTLPYLSQIIRPNDTTTFHYVFKPNRDDNFYGPPENLQYQPFKVFKVWNGGLNTDVFEKVGQASYDELGGTAQMKTTSAAGTLNSKDYSLSLDRATMLWIGLETANDIDIGGQPHHRYEYSADRLLCVNAQSSPDSGVNWFSYTFRYDAKDNLVRATDPMGNQTTRSLPNGMDLVASVNENGVCVSNEYDAKGNLLFSIEDACDSLTVVRDGAGNPIDVFSSPGISRITTYTYNSAGQVITTTDPLGRSSYNFYSQDGVPKEVTFYEDTTHVPQPADVGYLVATRDAQGRVSTYTYDALGRQTIVNSPGTPGQSPDRYIVTTDYDPLDRVTTTHFPDNTYSHNVYKDGYPSLVRDRAGRWTTNSFDAAGHLVSVAFPNGDVVTKTYKGDLLSSLSDGGTRYGARSTTHYYYDHEQLVGVVFPDSSKRAAGFDNLNRQLWAVDERGVAVQNTYDDLGRLLNAQYQGFNSSLAESDQTEWPSTFPCGDFVCDTSSIYPPDTLNHSISYTYDNVGNLLSMTDWTGTKNYAYDNLNRRIIESSSITDIQNPGSSILLSITNKFDLADNRITNNYAISTGSQNAWHQYVRSFDALDRLDSLDFSMPSFADPSLPDVIRAGYAYNANGKIASLDVQRNGATIHGSIYSYDSQNRLINIHDAASSLNLDYAYNDAQQITSISESADEHTCYAYDNRDQLGSETHHSATPSLQYAKSFFYDRAQNRYRSETTMGSTTPGGTTEKDCFDYAPANKLDSITDDAALPDDNDGVPFNDEIMHGSNPSLADTDNDGVSDADEIAQNTCPWRPDSDNDGLQDGVDPQPNFPSSGVWFGATNAVQHWWWVTSPSKPTYNFRQGAHHKYTYDRAGNLVQSEYGGSILHFFYNAQNKLSKIDRTASGTTTILYEFIYDSQDRRIGVKKGAEPWRFDLHDGAICIASVINGIIDQIFVRGAGIAEGTGDVLAEIDSTGAPHFYVGNHRGDTLRVVADDGDNELDLRFDAFGNLASSIQHHGSFQPRYTFSTKEYLSEVKLFLYACRVYDPVAARWLQRDPIDFQDLVNLYQFCGNDPVNNQDPDGRFGVVAVAAVVCFAAYHIVVPAILLTPGQTPAITYIGTPYTLRGVNYENRYNGWRYERRRTALYKYIVDEHEYMHSGGSGEMEASRFSYELAEEYLCSGKGMGGMSLSKAQVEDLEDLAKASAYELRHNWKSSMTDNQWDAYQRRFGSYLKEEVQNKGTTCPAQLKDAI